ncbi:hypothetical protein GCM10010405_59670 [Streptomyces macrosporus]|uniref:Uncharacterized protein n=1 Tax=Streptomyces macrosporus TaxID=44032 RepID=A0ABN3KQJ4_9ACTN
MRTTVSAGTDSPGGFPGTARESVPGKIVTWADTVQTVQSTRTETPVEIRCPLAAIWTQRM